MMIKRRKQSFAIAGERGGGFGIFRMILCRKTAPIHFFSPEWFAGRPIKGQHLMNLISGGCRREKDPITDDGR